MFMAFDPRCRGEDWTPERHRDEVRANADLGVTWHQIAPSGGDAAMHVLDVVRRYADEVVSQMS